MRYIVSFLVLVSSVLANDYYAKLEPIYTYNIKSSVAGKVIYTNDKLEAKIANNSVIVKIDNKLNQIELSQTKIKLQHLQQILKIQKDTLKSFNKVSSKSKLEKDSQKITILNTSATISDLSIKIATLQDTIKNKTLKEKSSYISNIFVKEGDWVNRGTLLYSTSDLSKAKLEIFVSIKDIETITNKTIFLDGKKTDLKIDKIYQTTDTKHISAYKVNIIVPQIKVFSKLVKINFN
jgi:TfoX/Sxy family transcriptional regulator of competence genes